MGTYQFSSRSPEPRVLCVSYRGISPVISRCGHYEFEDLIATVDAVDVVSPTDSPDPADARTALQNGLFTFRQLGTKLSHRISTKLEGTLPRTGRRGAPADLAGNYDLLYVSAQSPTDLYNIGPCAMWRSKARVAICYVDEIFAADVAGLGDIRKILSQFDHILVSVQEAVAPLSAATGRPCHYVAPSTDVLKFCPYPAFPKRFIDVYAMGSSRPPEAHDALLRLARERGWYYTYDTTTNCRVSSHIEHRSRLAEMIKRSQFFLVTGARWYDTDRTGGQFELGLRFFEGAAAGAVLVGDAPRGNRLFDEYFGWPDAVIPSRLTSDEIAVVLTDLAADPVRLARISSTNVVNSLRRHDHVHRWSQILSIAGVTETAAMTERRNELETLAAVIERSAGMD